MNRFTCSNMTQENIRFKVQIGNYSEYVCKGYYTSPEFSTGQSESEWSLLVGVYDGADHESFIDVRLKRDNHAAEEQYVNVKMAIVSCFGFNVLKKEKKLFFSDSIVVPILSVAKEHLKDRFGLKKLFYLPDDTLTLQCDLTVHESKVSSYEKEESFFRNIFGGRKRKNSNSTDFFTHSRLVREDCDYFTWKIRDFSIHAYGGHSVSPQFESEHFAGKWNLAVYTMMDDCYGECIDIRLARRESYDQQMVKAKLAIVDRSGKVLKFKEKTIYFTSPREVPMLSFTEKDISGWFGLGKKQLMPDDTLTLRCEMVSFKQIDDNFSRKADFDNSVKSFGYTWLQSIPYLIGICFMLPVALSLFYKLCLAILLFIWGLLIDMLDNMKYFLAGVVVLALLFAWIKSKAEKIKREAEESRRQNERRLRLQQKRKSQSIQYYDYDRGYYGKNDVYYYIEPQKNGKLKYIKY